METNKKITNCEKDDRYLNWKSSLLFIDDEKKRLTQSGKDYINYYMSKWIEEGKIDKIKEFYKNSDPLVQAYLRNNIFVH